MGAITDTDGVGGGSGPRAGCGYGYERDDTYAGYSNHGADVDIVAPGTCVASTNMHDPDGAPVNDDDTETITLPQNAVITIDKAAVDTDADGLIWNDADGNGYPDAGETVDYSFDVTNDGNVTLYNVTVTDNDGVVVGSLSGLTDEDGDGAADDLA